MKSLKKLRESTQGYNSSEAYAQYLHRTNQPVCPESWFDFMCARNSKRNIAIPLRVINGGIK